MAQLWEYLLLVVVPRLSLSIPFRLHYDPGYMHFFLFSSILLLHLPLFSLTVCPLSSNSSKTFRWKKIKIFAHIQETRFRPKYLQFILAKCRCFTLINLRSIIWLWDDFFNAVNLNIYAAELKFISEKNSVKTGCGIYSVYEFLFLKYWKYSTLLYINMGYYWTCHIIGSNICVSLFLCEKPNWYDLFVQGLGEGPTS